jgi:hypothetical protein
VHLTNKLHTEGVVIHWHGIRQVSIPWSTLSLFLSLLLIKYMQLILLKHLCMWQCKHPLSHALSILYSLLFSFAERNAMGRWDCFHFAVCY